jgi:hypothetical protein
MAVDPDRSTYGDNNSGKWVTERIYAELHSISRQTLANWRYRDRRAGRCQATIGYPQYRYFGSTVRYWVPSQV